jgi:hypothetical protein
MPHNSLATLIASAMVLVAFVTYRVQIVSKKRDAESGAPAEDEFTRLSRVYSGSQAFIDSMCLWLLIFRVQFNFLKQSNHLH